MMNANRDSMQVRDEKLRVHLKTHSNCLTLSELKLLTLRLCVNMQFS